MTSDSDLLKISELKGPAAEQHKKQISEKEFPQGLCTIGPYGYVASKCSAPQFHEILDCDIRPDDVWICGFPRSGTTWLQELVWLIENELDFGKAKAVHIQSRVPCISSALGRDVPNYAPERIEGLLSPRCIKSHQPYYLLPKKFHEINPKMIFIRRDPKDVVVSYYHFHVAFKDFIGTLDDFVDAFVNDVVQHCPYFGWLRSYWDVRKQSNILCLTYEQMKQNLPEVIQIIADFLGKTVSHEDSEKLQDHLNFSKMKGNPSINLDGAKEFFEKKFQKPWTNTFIRKGEAGAWEQELSKESVEKLNRWIEEKSVGLIGDWR